MTNPNDPAFPYKYSEDPGLTKREEFAKAAMQGCVAREGHFYLYRDSESVGEDVNTPERYAKVAVAYADALLAELSKEVKA